ncbi:SCO family protein [Pseudoxanthomonas putridarboris]|uniref:SCO family protein n=1 Tax=Pseudoxanthomonas putridarboris TaxID=752605 RepID=A0ABU9IZW1_9GAMM
MTIRLSRRSLLGAALGAGVAGMAPAFAAQRPLQAPVKLVDASMLDVHAGRQLRLVSDVMRGRVVALSFFFTGCSTVCPVQALAMAHAQKRLGNALGARVALVSISIDWYGDTEQDIRRFAAAHGAGTHWHFLKAPPATVDAVREGFDAYAPQRDNHPPVVAVGRAGSREWSRLYGLPSGDTIADEIGAWLA